MDFPKHAARETSALVGRLVADAYQKVAGDLQACRQALDMMGGTIESALARQADPEYREAVAAFGEQLAAQLAAHTEAAAEQVRAEAQVTIDGLQAALAARSEENAQLAATLAEAQAECARIAETGAAVEAAGRKAEAALENARREQAATEDDLRTVREQFEASRSEVARMTARHDEDAGELARLNEALDAAATSLQEAEARNRDLLARTEAQARDLGRLQQEVEEKERAHAALRERLDAASLAAAALRQRVEAAERETERVRVEAELAAQASVRAARTAQAAEARAERLLVDQAEAIRRDAGEFLSASLDRLLAMYLTIASGATTDDVLAAVSDALAVQFSRVALFHVQGNHLEGVRQAGFELRADISQVLIPRTLDSLLTKAVASGRIETRSAGEPDDGNSTPFGGTPDFALALPIVVDGQALAVVYADDWEQAQRDLVKPELRVKFAQLLQCHAMPLLTRLCSEAKELADLDQYATLLLNELEQTYAADAGAAPELPASERRNHLRENIEYAQRLYAQRAAAEGPRAAALFDRCLLAAADARAGTPFGQDLGALVAGRLDADAPAVKHAAANGAGTAAS